MGRGRLRGDGVSLVEPRRLDGPCGSGRLVSEARLVLAGGCRLRLQSPRCFCVSLYVHLLRELMSGEDFLLVRDSEILISLAILVNDGVHTTADCLG